jgi:uncharacterized protein (TIGR02599 family)
MSLRTQMVPLRPFSLPGSLRPAAFTVVELLAAMAVFIGIMLLLVTATNSTGDIWRRSSSKIEQFQQSRRGFEAMTRRIGQATLNTYWDYDYELDSSGNPMTNKPPIGYRRQSELRFRSGLSKNLLADVKDGVPRPTHSIFFQAPLGFVNEDLGLSGDGSTEADPSKVIYTHKPLNNLLNTWGYFLEVGDDKDTIPAFMEKLVKPRYRSRLMELMEPSETLRMDNPSQMQDALGAVITADSNWDNPKYLGWFVSPVAQHKAVRVLSENVLALVILPKLTTQDTIARAAMTPAKTEPLCPVYDYDSKRIANTASSLSNPKVKATDPDLNPKNQLPPVVTVAMVAIDENSARRLAEISAAGDSTFGIDMHDLFLSSPLLEDDPSTPNPGDGDLSKLEKRLVEKKLTYRIFTSNVAIRGAKWSRWQEN